MSLTISPISKTRTYIPPQRGDIGQDPESTNPWASFLSDDDGDRIAGRAKSRDVSFRENQNILTLDTGPAVQSDTHRYERPKASGYKVHVQNASEIITHTEEKPAPERKGQDFSKGINEFFGDELKQRIFANFKKNPADGTLEMINKEHMAKQKKVLGFLLKQFGSALFSGRSITTVSVPVFICEPQSYVEREARNLCHAPQFLEKAGELREPLEQFKYAVAHFLTCLPVNVYPKKPFNPIIGETFQGIIGGCPVYVEQISHHPPVAALQMVGKNFTLEFLVEITVHFSMSEFKLCRVGHQKVHFKNTNTTIEGQLPPWCARGSLVGKKSFQYADKLYVYDLKNKLYAELVFDYEESTLFKKSTKPQDHFSGGIWRINDKFAEELKKHPKKPHELNEYRFKEKEHSVGKLATIEGLWLEYLKIDGKTYWTMGDPQPYRMQYFENPIPSDCNFRLDVLSMRAGDEVKAQIEKDKLEEIQRNDAKLRKKYQKKSGK